LRCLCTGQTLASSPPLRRSFLPLLPPGIAFSHVVIKDLEAEPRSVRDAKNADETVTDMFEK
jgi:hypothetical protein